MEPYMAFAQTQANQDLSSSGNGLLWFQIFCQLCVLAVTTFASYITWKTALSKDVREMRQINRMQARQRRRTNYQEVSSFDDSIEDAYETRQQRVDEESERQRDQ